MSNCFGEPVMITVDLKKYRIRVHRAALHKIGDPSLIQLLVNPKEMVVAIRAVDKGYSNDQTHKVRIVLGDSYEIYSRLFMRRLCSLRDDLKMGHSYRLIGTAEPENGLLVFPLSSMQPIDGTGGQQ